MGGKECGKGFFGGEGERVSARLSHVARSDAASPTADREWLSSSRDGTWVWTNEVIIPVNYPALRMQAPGPPWHRASNSKRYLFRGPGVAFGTRRITSNGGNGCIHDRYSMYVHDIVQPAVNVNVSPPYRCRPLRADRSIDDFILQPGYNVPAQ